MKRIVCLLLVSILLCTAIIPASAAVIEPDEPCFNYIRSTSITLLIDESTGIASCYARCYSLNDTVTIKISGTLQQYKSGKWENMCGWVQFGTTVVIMDKQVTVSSGYQYRFVANYYIYDSEGNLLESSTATRTCNY